MSETYYISKKNDRVRQVVDLMMITLRAMYKLHDVEVILKKPTSKRSGQQNAYLHKLIGLIADFQGAELEKVKREIKHSIGLIEKNMVNGELITEIRSTADLSKEEFSKLIEEVIKVCVYLDIEYPIPSMYGYDMINP